MVAPLTFRSAFHIGGWRVSQRAAPIVGTAAGLALVGATWVIVHIILRLLFTSTYEVEGYMNGYILEPDDWGTQFKPLFGLASEQDEQDLQDLSWFDHAVSYSYELNSAGRDEDLNTATTSESYG